MIALTLEQKISNREYCVSRLKEERIPYRVINNGSLFIVAKNGMSIIDLWPSTESYRVRNRATKNGRGVDNMIAYYKEAS